MVEKCSECGVEADEAYISRIGLNFCKTCYYAELASFYLKHLKKNHSRDEVINKHIYQQAKELSVWISFYRFGNDKMKKLAANYLCNWIQNE